VNTADAALLPRAAHECRVSHSAASDRAAECFRKTIALGAGESAREGLAEVLAQIDES
jgi:hypothetical protein